MNINNNLISIKGYRNLLGMTQDDLAKLLCISKQSYYLKEKGKIPFNDREKILLKQLLQKIIPEITIDEIFF